MAHSLTVFAILLHFSALCCTLVGKKVSNPRVPHVKATKSNRGVSNVGTVGYEVCAETCSQQSCTTYYCAGDGICCTPGSKQSLCCPADHPVCLDEGCCISGSTHVCKDKCCTSDSSCCTEVDNCCESAETCCNSEECCDEESPCCRNTGEQSGECCNEETMACCGDGYGCATPCPSQFDAIPCDEEGRESFKETREESVNIECPTLETGKLYRVTDPNQNCQGGIIAKDPTAKKTVSSHVGCGSRPNYKSQYISFSTSYDVVHDKYWPLKPPGARLVEVNIHTQIPSGCNIYDLTNPEVRQEYIGHNPWAMNYAKSDCEVLLECGTSRVRCKTLLGPKQDEDTVVGDKKQEL